MNYSFTTLKTKADCDAVITIATKEKSDQEWRKQSLERQAVTSVVTTQEIEAELAALNAELTFLDGVIANSPEGKAKQEYVIKWKKADTRKSILVNRQASYGAVAAMDKQYDIGCCEKLIEETDKFISLVTAHRDGL